MENTNSTTTSGAGSVVWVPSEKTHDTTYLEIHHKGLPGVHINPGWAGFWITLGLLAIAANLY